MKLSDIQEQFSSELRCALNYKSDTSIVQVLDDLKSDKLQLSNNLLNELVRIIEGRSLRFLFEFDPEFREIFAKRTEAYMGYR